ncbi:MAG: DNA polymerase III subunit chi [Burkholderiaceae bacterium]|nr:DNA polymerase III subunit chi [Burkholderiaceae bacterium]MCD8517579.1 DNA polymerase III subunit chi [Burkholderiaceae bacterium]MCD8537373.1 DNA polymerase III subunit chi [Burkholderiaceae bacterium]MCD8564591.1 DNA polymerase III subunit chi [Burkholderiaceae bacterium]
MTRVDFAFNADARVQQAARSILRHVNRGARLFVYCDDPDRMTQIDQALWSVSDTSFVPHERLLDEQTETLPIYLVDQAAWPLVATRVTEADWLVNLDDDCPPEPTLFTRVLEIVSCDEVDRELARQRWRQYQAMGLDLHAHQLSDRGER